MAEKVVFTGSTYTIKAKPEFNSFDVREDLYSWAKLEWNLEVDNLHKYPFPFIVIGGNDIGGGQTAPSYFFLRSPWVFETNGVGELHNVATNLYAVESDGVTTRSPFNVLAGDSTQNSVSDIPGSDLLRIILENIDMIKSLMNADEVKSSDGTVTKYEEGTNTILGNPKQFTQDCDTGEASLIKK